MKPVIVFDLSEVLIRGLIGIEPGLASSVGLSPAETLALFGGDLLQRYCCGQCTEDEYLDAVIRAAPALEREMLKGVIRENFRHEIKGTRELARLLAVRYRVVLLSDHGREWIEHILGIHSWLTDFEERYFSFDRGVTKRQVAAFEGLGATLGVPPGRCVLIDDSGKNVAVARQAGWIAIQFTTSEQLARDLMEMDLLPQA